MLQVISGKFYSHEGDITETPSRGIIYSNTACPITIRTSIATLELANSDGGIGSYVMEYVARFEQRGTGFRPLRIGERTIVEQFRLLSLFFFKAYFSTSRDEVVRTCHAVGGHGARNNPASYVRGFLNPSVALSPESIAEFCRFVDKALSLPRDVYEKVMDCLRCFANAIELAGYNMDLAYSMLVYCAEALSQGFDNFVPIWDDASDNLKNALHAILDGIDATSADGIKGAILAQQHFKLGKRFTTFITNHLPETFYTVEASSLLNPIRPSELPRLLTNVYAARSKFVHTLTDIRNQLKVPQVGNGEVFHHSGDPFLTFNGMVRLVHTVLTEFIQRQPSTEKENFDWYKNLSNIIPDDVVEFPPAPNYWIGAVQSAVPEISDRRLTGFLSSVFEGQVPDMNAVVEKYIDLLPSVAAERHRQHMALLCELYLYIFSHLPEVADLEKKYNRVRGVLNKPSIHSMLLQLLKGEGWTHPVEKSAELYSSYERNRFKSEFSIPLRWELTMMLAVANGFHRDGSHQKCAEWKTKARLEAAGNPDLQNDIERSLAVGGHFHLNGLQNVTYAETERKSVEEAAYYISLQRVAANEPGDDRSDWLKAEMEIVSQR